MEGEIIMSWEAPEYTHYEKTTDWYWWAGVVVVVLLGIAVWQRSFLFGVLILIGWFTVILYAVRRPQNVNFALAEKGITINNTFYPWNSLKSFWVFNNPPLRQELSIASKKTLMPYIKIPLGDTDVDKVDEIVSRFLPKVEQEESIVDHIAHVAKF